MKRMSPRIASAGAALVALAGLAAVILPAARGRAAGAEDERDAHVRAFLESSRGQWHDMNVPYQDGQALYDLIVKRGLKRGLEIGTSTGHSGVWIAWALSKTGGKLVTIEIDPERHQTALQNFEKAGLASFVDARLADAHELVPRLAGPFDFVFCDADKGWYTRYFQDLEKKVPVGGCYTAHNVLNGFGGVDAFMDYVRSRPDFETEVLHTSHSGISVSCRTR